MLNLLKYKAKAKYSKTKRIRSLTILAPSAAFVEKRLLAEGYLPPITVTIIPPKMPTLRQLELCRSLEITIPDQACFYDIKALLDNEFNRDTKRPSNGLQEFATNHGIIFSSYLCKKGLYDIVFTKLPLLDKIAFFIFSVYRSLSNDRRSNLDTHTYVNIFYDFAKDKICDKRYLKSMSSYTGKDIRFFGSITYQNSIFGDQTYYGGSTKKTAFKEAKMYLINTGVLDPAVSEHKYLQDKKQQSAAHAQLVESYQVKPLDINHNKPSPEESFYLVIILFNLLLILIALLFIIRTLQSFILFTIIIIVLNAMFLVQNKK